jgi:hypothetical protein
VTPVDSEVNEVATASGRWLGHWIETACYTLRLYVPASESRARPAKID